MLLCDGKEDNSDSIQFDVQCEEGASASARASERHLSTQCNMEFI